MEVAAGLPGNVACLVLQDVCQLGKVLQLRQQDEARAEGVVQQRTQGLHDGLHTAPTALRCWREEVLMQVMLHMAGLQRLLTNDPSDRTRLYRAQWCLKCAVAAHDAMRVPSPQRLPDMDTVKGHEPPLTHMQS